MGRYNGEFTEGSERIQGILLASALNISIRHRVFCLHWGFWGLQEELGLEYDEDVDVSLQSFTDLMQHGKKRARGQ